MVPIDEALQIVRATWPSNDSFLDDLQDRLTRAHAIPLVPFIGAGLSIPMGFPSWTGFLGGLALECGKSAEVASLLVEGEYEEAAEAVERGLGEAIFHRRVAHTFGERRSRECELQGAALALPYLATGPVLTTNFDRTIERIFAEAGRPFEHIAWGSQVDSMRRAAAENRPFLLKIHGDAEERSDRVLTKSEYETSYARGNPDGLRAQLARALQSRTLLFIGCSLAKDRTVHVLTEVLGQASGLEHFAIIEKPASDDAFFTKQQSLGNCGVLPIWYPTGRHDLIEPLLRWGASLQPASGAAGPDMVLERTSQRKSEVRSELDLLNPYQRTTAFVGREADLEGLRTWVQSEVRISVRVVTGDGGSGKTRLAIELLAWLATVDPARWNFGFLTQQEIERFSALQNLSQWRPREPVLAVVDYAAGSAERLRVWLTQLAAAEYGGEKLRVLLLEREASLEVGWLSSVISHGYSSAGVRGLFDPFEPVRLRAVGAGSDRRSVLRATLEAGAALRGIAPPYVPMAGVDVLFDRKIEQPEWGDPLALMIAGLTALDTGLPAAMALGRVDLAFRLADRELSRIAHFSKDTPVGLLEHMVACVTISGGLSREELREMAKTESDAVGRQHPAGWAALADATAEALRAGDRVKPVEPAAVGEALLLRLWGSLEVREGCKSAVRVARAHGPRVVAFVIRMAQDFCVGEAPRPEPLEWLDALIASAESDLAMLWQIEAELPPKTIALRERAVVVDLLMAAVLRAAGGKDALPELSRVLNNLGVCLTNLGRHEEALQIAEEAARMSRQMAAWEPDDFLTGLAIALDNLGNALSFVGRPEDALKATEEAVQINRQLLAQHPDALPNYLARSLNNLGSRLRAVGRHAEALNAAEEAVGLRRKLIAQRPDAFVPDLAASLFNVGVSLCTLGRTEEAQEAIEESIPIYRRLAAQLPDAFLADLAKVLSWWPYLLCELRRPDEARGAAHEAVRIYRQLSAQRREALPQLAAALNTLGDSLNAVGLHAEALQAAEEAVGTYRQISTGNDALLAELAGSLGNLSISLSDLDRTDEAIEAANEAVSTYQQLAAKNSAVILPDLARSLDAVGICLRKLGRGEEALKAIGAAVDAYRRLETQRPLSFLAKLAGSLNNFGAFLRELGHPEEALKSSEEALSIYRQLEERNPNTHLPSLAASLNNFGNCMRELGNPEEALKFSDEGVQIYQRLRAKSPEALLPDYAGALDNLGVCLRDLGRNEEALQVTREAVGIYQQLTAQRPSAFLTDYAISLHNLSACLKELGRPEEWFEATDELIGVRRRLAAKRPEAFLPALADSLNVFGDGLRQLGKSDEASRAASNAAGIYKQLATQQPDAFLPKLALALDNLGSSLSDMGRHEEALSAVEEAVGIGRELAVHQPEAFPHSVVLAVSLVVRTEILERIGKVDARTVFQDALACLKPAFLHAPSTCEPMMRHLVHGYRRACANAGAELDMDLLGGVLPLLADDSSDTTAL
jgi:tetratricopeptide (TPR) repeat protein